jgi:hypothetical protein
MANKYKFFDLHVEVGLDDHEGMANVFYARTVIAGSIEYREEGSTPATAVGKLMVDLERQNLWKNMANNPQSCGYPFPGAQTPLAAYIDLKAPKKRPMDLTGVAYPGCQGQCTSFDNFGAEKCRSMCQHRTGV